MAQQAEERQRDRTRRRQPRWPRWHASTAPIGIIAVTALLVGLSEPSQWRLPDILDLASRRVELGAVGYALAVVLAERGIDMIFWALDQRRERQERLREEGRAEGQAALVTKMREIAQADESITVEEMLERLSQEVEASGNGAKGK